MSNSLDKPFVETLETSSECCKRAGHDHHSIHIDRHHYSLAKKFNKISDCNGNYDMSLRRLRVEISPFGNRGRLGHDIDD